MRISQLGSYKGEPACLDMERAYFSVSQDNGRWKHSLQQLSDGQIQPLIDFETGADTFVQLLGTF